MTMREGWRQSLSRGGRDTNAHLMCQDYRGERLLQYQSRIHAGTRTHSIVRQIMRHLFVCRCYSVLNSRGSFSSQM
jgi:hypothetical protein